MLRGTIERNARAQMVQCLGGLAQWAQTQPTSALRAPQMVLPLCQPLPGWPAMPYQQAVQLPKKSTGWGITSDPSTDKTAPTGGTSSQDHGRPTTRGRGDCGRSVSCPRGAQGEASAQPLCQEGDLPSGSMPSVPPPAAPEGTQPQHGGQPRSALRDPMQLAARFRSAGWKKDLEHVLWVYYKYNTASFKEAEWARLKETFFRYFLLHKEEALGIKERCPINYMAYIEDHFYRATGLHLNGLRSFTAWIKQGSYYHGLVAQQGCLHECPHLASLPLPRQPQVMPSESCWESQMKVEATATSSSKPSAGATMAPVMETPVMEAPVAETPGAQTPAVETPAAPSDTPAPMETGGAGDGQSWAEHVEADVEEEFQQDRPVKRRRSQSKKHEPRPMLSFPLQDSEGRLTSISQLYEHAGEQPPAHHNVAGRGIMHLHPELLPRKATHLGNQVTCMIAEYHLTSSAQGPLSLSPILLAEAAALLPPIKNYVPGIAFKGCRDVRVMDQARTFRVAVWLHRLDMAVTGDGMASETLEASQHHQGPLLESLLTLRMSNLSFWEVVDCILQENWCASERSLNYLLECRTHAHQELDERTKAHRESNKSDKSSRKRIKKEINLRCKDLESLREHISYYESHLGQDPSGDDTPDDDSLFGHGAQARMATAPGVNDAPSESATTQASDPPPTEGQTHAMEVDDKGTHPRSASPVSTAEDDLLMDGGAIGVESDLAHLMVSSPRSPNGEGKEASV